MRYALIQAERGVLPVERACHLLKVSAITSFGHSYRHECYHEARVLDNVTPADTYSGRYTQVTSQRERIKQQTLQQRRQHYLRTARYSG